MSPAILAKADTAARRARLGSMANPAALCGIDPSSRYAPVLADVRETIIGARAIVAREPYYCDLLLAALADAEPKGNGLATHYARRMLCRLAGTPHLPAWLDEPYRTRGDVLRLLIRAASVFAPMHRGGWVFSSGPRAVRAVSEAAR